MAPIAAAWMLTPLSAHAQDAPRVGVTMGYPSAVGVLWHVWDRVALRPEATAAKGSSESSSSDSIVGTPGNSTPADNWQVGVGISALFYLTRADSFRTYVTPRFAYSTTSSSTNVGGSPVASTSDGWTYTTSGSFGAQYSVGRHFGIFGEIGGSYGSSTVRTSTVETITTGIGVGVGGIVTRTTGITLRSDTHSHSLSTRSGVGVIVYF